MYIKIRNTKYIYRLIETPDGRSYWLEWTDDQGLFRRQTISKWDATGERLWLSESEMDLVENNE